MARKKDNGPAPSRRLDQDEIRAGIARLSKRAEELNAFDPSTISDGNPPELMALSTAITDSLAKTFGAETHEYRQYIDAADLAHTGPMFFYAGMPPTPLSEKRASVREHIKRALALVNAAIASLREDVANDASLLRPSLEARGPASRRVFVVHGHDEGAREMVARFLERLGFDAVILHERANQGKTVIEKVEAHGDVSFAVVLLTPDDVGGAAASSLLPRARQNVILELGYFVGRLGRDKVCALKKGAVELPSDFGGVVYEDLDEGGAWKQALARELDAAGHTIDWNLVMKRS
jgi:predicted nucleotide-binding protein